MKAILLIVLVYVGQTEPTPAVLSLTDGSILPVVITQPTLEIQTKYGRLAVPFSDVRSIVFAGRVANEPVLRALLEDLGATSFADREKSGKLIIEQGPGAYPFLLQAARSSDSEISDRAGKLAVMFRDKFPAERLCPSLEDTIQAVDLEIRGKIVSPVIAVKSLILGDLNAKVLHLRSLRIVPTSSAQAVHTDADWVSTGIYLDDLVKVSASAEGNVDLWPVQPGQYICGPAGYTSKTGEFQAGALLVKIGSDPPFALGERAELRGLGMIHFKVNPNPWNGFSMGSYTVRLSASLKR